MEQRESGSEGLPLHGAGQSNPAGQPPADPAPPASGSRSSAGPLRRTIRVVNPLGLHHRVADRFVRTARGFASIVTVWNGEIRADGKSLWDLLGLLAFEGTDVILEVDGPDATAAVEPLAGILGANGGEDYTI